MGTFRDELTVKFTTVDDLPTLPSIIMELARMLHQDTAGMAEVAVVIEEDPAIAASVLRVANSALCYSTISGTLVSVRDALVRIGLKEVNQIVSAAAFIRAFKRTGPHLQPGRFWRFSLRTAVAARVIARASRGAGTLFEDEAYTAGLLHDVGLLILDQYFPDVYDRLQAASGEPGFGEPDVERSVLGLDHGEIGGYLLDHWNLPEVLVQAVTWHNQPDCAKPEAQLLAKAVRVSEMVAEVLEAEGDVEELTQILLSHDLWAKLGITPEAVAGILDETKRQSTPVFALA